MEYNEILQMITNTCFPIAACVVMFKQNDRLRDTLQQMSETMVLLTEKIADIERKIDRGGIEYGK